MLGTTRVGSTSGQLQSGVLGEDLSTGGMSMGVTGSSTSGTGVFGMVSASSPVSATGVFGVDQSTAPGNYGVYGTSINGYAGYFAGNVTVTGILSASAKDFKIDHPLDPANKFLYHSSVESSEMMNIYSGNVITDAQGEATVSLPDWFEVLNTDFRYQLTVIGQFAQAIVSHKISNHQFQIKTNAPNVEVSWQVTAVRQDAYARAHPLITEVAKTGDERGRYLHPVEHGVPKSLGIDEARMAKLHLPKLPEMPKLPLRASLPVLPKLVVPKVVAPKVVIPKLVMPNIPKPPALPQTKPGTKQVAPTKPQE
jgi:hypothetical protein